MIHNCYRFALEFFTLDNRSLGQIAAEIDWQPAVEWTEFSVQRRGSLHRVSPQARVVSVEPIPEPSHGMPYCRGFRIALTSGEEPPQAIDFSTAYFRPYAQQYSALLVEKGLLNAGEKFQYTVVALPVEPQTDKPVHKPAFSVEETPVALPVWSGRIASYLARAEAKGMAVGSDTEHSDFPVFIPSRVLREAQSLTAQAGAREIGGILIGHLCWDETLPEIAAVVSAQIPAQHTEAELCQLTFTPQTWTAVQSAIALRHKQEIMLGWWHSHPAQSWCQAKDCPPEKRRVCQLQTTFFSGDDSALHRTVFPKAFHTALVITDTDQGMQERLYGWRRGGIHPRGFYRLEDSVSAMPEGETAMEGHHDKVSA